MGRIIDNRLYKLNASIRRTTPYQEFRDNLQAKINEDFTETSDLVLIQEEQVYGSKIWSDVEVRITHVINSATGEKLGDDFRGVIFQDLQHAYGMGFRYQFNDNVWITTNSDFYKFPTISSTVRRCNNVLRWYDKDGNLCEEPCFIDYVIKNNNIESIKQQIILDGDVEVCTQMNQYTINILENQRFIFDGKAYKIRAVNNFLRQKTNESNSVPLVKFTMYKTNIAPNDDLVNSIADTNYFDYSISINSDDFNQSVGYSGQLSATVKLNEEIVIKDLTWESSDDSKATIDGLGNFTLLSIGLVNFTCSITDNPIITNGISVNIVTITTPISDIIITPDVNKIYRGDTQFYTVFKYLNNVLQADTFTITSSGVPASCYEIQIIDGNTFSVKNTKTYNNSDLIITCTDDIDSTFSTINIKMGGVF